MFSSWKVTSANNGKAGFSERPQVFNPVTAKTAGPQACMHCRAQKLKCTGEKGGCRRCLTLGRKCCYAVKHRRPATVGPVRTGNVSSSGATTVPAPTNNSMHTHTASASTSASASPPYRSALQASSSSSASTIVDVQSPLPLPQLQCQWTDQRQQYTDPELADFVLDDVDVLFIDGIEGPLSPPPTRGGGWGAGRGGALQFVGATLGSEIASGGESLPFSSSDEGGYTPSSLLSASPCATTITSSSAENVANVAPEDPSTTTQSRQSPTTPSPTSCQCLHRILILMDELDLLLDDSGLQLDAADRALASHKEALQQGARMLECAVCRSRIENMTILSFLADKLAQLCRRVAGAICSSGSSTIETPPPPRLPLLVPNAVVGAYSIDSPAEYTELIRCLLGFQLRRSHQLIQQLQHVAARFCSDTIDRRLAACKRTTTSTWEKLGSRGI